MHDQTSPIVSGITGNSAEWIVERPLVSQNPTTYAILPYFGWADMWHAQAFDRASWSWIPYSLGPYRRLYMYDSGTGHVLATVERTASGDIKVWWLNYQ